MSLAIAPTTERRHAWRGRPLAAWGLRALVVIAPLTASFVVATTIAHAVRRPHGATALAWWVSVLGVSTLALITTDRLVRRLLPLASLFTLSLVFPDRTPSRLSIALRTGTAGQLQQRLHDLRLRGDEATGAAELLALVAASNIHDAQTRGHSERVRALADLMADQLHLGRQDREKLRWAALLHDIGKLAVPTEILNKCGRPTDEEWVVLKTHPDEGMRLVRGPVATWLGDWAAAVGEHHERWDGGGYPNGLAGEEISLGGRLVAVVDAFDVMTSPRSYQAPMSAADARLELTRCAGSQFDPAMVRAFLEISTGRLRRAMGPAAWVLQIALVGQLVPGAAVGLTAIATAAAALTTGLAGGTVPSAGIQLGESRSVALLPFSVDERGGLASVNGLITIGAATVTDRPGSTIDAADDSAVDLDVAPSTPGPGAEVPTTTALPSVGDTPLVATGPPPTDVRLPDGSTATTTPPSGGSSTPGGPVPATDPGGSTPTSTTDGPATTAPTPVISVGSVATPGVQIGTSLGLGDQAIPVGVSVPTISVPGIVVSGIGLGGIELPSVVVPEISIPNISITIPEITLPALPVLPPLPALPGLQPSPATTPTVLPTSLPIGPLAPILGSLGL